MLGISLRYEHHLGAGRTIVTIPPSSTRFGNFLDSCSEEKLRPARGSCRPEVSRFMCDSSIQVNSHKAWKPRYSPDFCTANFHSKFHMLATSRLFSCEKAVRFQKSITDNTTSHQHPLSFKSFTRRQQRPRGLSKMTIAGFFSGLFGGRNGSEPQVGLSFAKS